MDTVIDFISKQEILKKDAIQGNQIRDTLLCFIKTNSPGFDDSSYLSKDEFNDFRRAYLLHLLQQENEDITSVEREVVNAITHNQILSENIEPILEEKLTLGQRMADKIALFGGSWYFITSFGLFMFSWIIINVIFLKQKPFDPYPFILLNLMLSCLAAIQAPIIMMSQNRLEQKDRLRSENDYKVNLKAELEIKLLHEKLDHLSVHQNKILFEIQQMQMEYLDEILEQLKNKSLPEK
ncbi:MAG: DUF1003 domain-containing protein [Bacteroidales bacterium]